MSNVLKVLQYAYTDSTYITGTTGGALRLDNLTNVYQLVGNFDAGVTVFANALRKDGTIVSMLCTLAKDTDGTQKYGSDVIDPTDSDYQTLADYLVWEGQIGDVSLQKISKYRAGTIEVNFSIYDLDIDETNLVTDKGAFGNDTGDVPASGTLGDYYTCESPEYASANAGATFIYGDVIYWDNSDWVKATVKTLYLNTSQKTTGIGSAVSHNTESLDADDPLTTAITDKLNDHEERITDIEATDLTTKVDENLVSNYPDRGTALDVDTVYINDTLANPHRVKIEDMLTAIKALPLTGGTLTGNIVTENVEVDTGKVVSSDTYILNANGKVRDENNTTWWEYTIPAGVNTWTLVTDKEIHTLDDYDLTANSWQITVDGTVLTFDAATGNLTRDGYVIYDEGNLPTIGVPTTPVQYIQWALDATVTYAEGKMYYDKDKKQPAYMLDNADFVLNFGFETVVPIINNTGDAVTDGMVVYPTGYDTDGEGVKRFEIGLANSQFKDKAFPVAVVTTPLADGETGYATKFGTVGDFDTTQEGFTTVGQKAYLGEDGLLVPDRPDNGHYPIIVGFIAELGATGTLQVDIINSELTVETVDTNGIPTDQKDNLKFGLYNRMFSVIPDPEFHYYKLGEKYEKDNSSGGTYQYVDGGDMTNVNDWTTLNCSIAVSTGVLTMTGDGSSSVMNISQICDAKLGSLVGSYKSYVKVKPVLGNKPDRITLTTNVTNNTYESPNLGVQVEIETTNASTTSVGDDVEVSVDVTYTNSANQGGSTVEVEYFRVYYTDEATFQALSASEFNTYTKTITPITGYWEGYNGVDSGSDRVEFPNTEGIHWFYYDGDTLSVATNPVQTEVEDLITNQCLLAFVKWDATNEEAILGIADERHGISMSPATHLYLHSFLGAQYASGMGLNTLDIDGSGDDETSAQFGIDNGVLIDEDNAHVLGSIGATVGLPILYLDGVNGDLRQDTNAGYSVIVGGNGRPMYNEWTGGAWTTTEIGNNDYGLVHVFASNILEDDSNTTTKFFVMMGQNEYGTVSQARNGATEEIANLVTGSLQLEEVLPVATLIFQTTDGYTNAVKMRYRSDGDGNDYINWTEGQVPNPSSPPSDHANLTGKDKVDQHPFASITNNSTGSYIVSGDDGQTTIQNLDVELENQDLRLQDLENEESLLSIKSYQGSHIALNEDEDAVAVVIPQKNMLPINTAEGKSYTQLVSNPSFRDGDTGWTSINIGTPSVTNEIVSFTATAQYAKFTQPFFTIAGNSYYMKARVKSTYAINLYMSDGSLLVADTHSGSGEYEELSGIVTAVSTLATGEIKLQDNRTSGWTQVDVDYIIVIPLPSDITTVAEMEALLDGYIREQGVWSVGEAITLSQVLDNSNDFGAYTLNASVVVDKTTEQNETPYIKIDGVGINAISSDTIQADTVYTIVTHILKNTNAVTNQIYIAWNGADAWATSITITDEVGIRIDVLTSGGTGGEHGIRVAGGSTAGTVYIQRQIILEGDVRDILSNYSNDELVRMVQESDTSIVLSGVPFKSVGKNKFDEFNLINGEIASSGTGVISASANSSRTDYLPIIPNETYTISGAITMDFMRIAMYDSSYNFIKGVAYGVGTNEETIEGNSETVYMIVSLYTIDKSLAQIELGSVATTYEAYEEAYAKWETGEDGQHSLPNEVRDTDKTQYIKKYTIVEDDIISMYTLFTNLDYVRVSKKSDYKYATSASGISGSFLQNDWVEGTEGDLSSNIGTISIDSSSTQLFYGVAKGTSLVDAKTLLVGENILYELETPIDRSLENNNLAEITGNVIFSDGGTLEVNGNGIVPRISINSGEEQKDRFGMIYDALKENQENIQDNKYSIDLLLDRVGVLEDDILYINPSPSAHTSADVYTFRNSIYDRTKVEVWFSTASSELFFVATDVLETTSARESEFSSHVSGSSTVKLETYFTGLTDGTSTESVSLEIGQPYQITHTNASTPSIATDTIYIWAIVKKGGFKL